MKALILNASIYGHSGRYAEMIASALTDAGWDVHTLTTKGFTVEEARETLGGEPDLVVYAGGNYAGKLHDVKAFVSAAHAFKGARLALLSVAWADPSRTDEVDKVHRANLPGDVYARTERFHARGGLAHSKVSFAHKAALTGVHAFMKATPASKRHANDQEMLDTWGTDTDFVKRDNIEPMLKALLDS